MDFIQYTGNDGNDGGPTCHDVFHEKQRVPTEEADGGSSSEHLCNHDAFEDVRERQVGKVSIVGEDGNILHSSYGRHDIFMGDESSFGISGGSRGVTKGGNI